MPSFTLKTLFKDETHRVKVNPIAFSFADLRTLLQSQYPKAARKQISYVDDEGDKITITSDAELREAFSVVADAGWKSLKLILGKKRVVNAKTNTKLEEGGSVASPKAPAAMNKTAAPQEAPAAPETEVERVVHWGYQCDVSGMKPIVGARYHKIGQNFDLCEEEFAKLLAETEAAEAAALNAFEKLSQDNKVSKTTKQGDVKGKTAEVKQIEVALSNYKEDHATLSDELSAVLTYLDKLKPQCETKAMSYAERKARREEEISGLKEALAILSDESFVQVSTSLRGTRRA